MGYSVRALEARSGWSMPSLIESTNNLARLFAVYLKTSEALNAPEDSAALRGKPTATQYRYVIGIAEGRETCHLSHRVDRQMRRSALGFVSAVF